MIAMARLIDGAMSDVLVLLGSQQRREG